MSTPTAPPEKKTPRLLIVEDDEDVRRALSVALSDAGYRVEEAGDGAQGLLSMRRSLPNLVLLDISMPQMDGVEFLRHVRSDKTLWTVGVLVLSGLTDRANLERALAEGADGYLFKPMALWELHSRVASLLRVFDLRELNAALERERHRATVARQICGAVSLRLVSGIRQLLPAAEFLIQCPGPSNEHTSMADSLASQLRDLLALSDGLEEYSRMAPSPLETVCLQDLLPSAVAMWGARGDPPRHASVPTPVSLLVPDDLPPICARRYELSMVFGELWTNAARAMPAGGTIRVCAFHEVAEVRVDVSDSGPGIPDELREKIFEPFATAEGHQERRGLGLPMVKSILDEIGGRVEVRSDPGAGTTIELGFPAHRASDEA